MALVLVFLKLPILSVGLPLQSWFARTLVLHVDLSILIWALSVVALIWLLHIPQRLQILDRVAMGLMFVSGASMLLSVLFGQGQPLLSNYIPVLDAPSYLFSLGGFVLAISIITLARVSVISSKWDQLPLSKKMFLLALWAFIATVSVQLIAWWTLAPLVLNLQRAEQLFWGAGHSLQAVYLCMLLGGWFYLLERSGVSLALIARLARHRIVIISVFSVIFTPLVISLAWAPDDPLYRQAFSIWMRLFSLPVLGVMSMLIWQLLGCSRQGLETSCLWRVSAVGLSMLLFFLGVVLGAMIRGDSLMVPAHYHATTGAVNLIFMAVIYDLLTAAKIEGSLQWQLKMYAAGVVLMVMGLAFSGVMGASRKLAASHEVTAYPAEMAAIVLMGIGAAIGLIASFWFVIYAFRSLLAPGYGSSQISVSKVMS